MFKTFFLPKILQNSLVDFSGCAHDVQEQSFSGLAQPYFSYWHGFFPGYQECRHLSKTHQDLWEIFIYVTGCSDQAVQFSDTATVILEKINQYHFL